MKENIMKVIGKQLFYISLFTLMGIIIIYFDLNGWYYIDDRVAYWGNESAVKFIYNYLSSIILFALLVSTYFIKKRRKLIIGIAMFFTISFIVFLKATDYLIEQHFAEFTAEKWSKYTLQRHYTFCGSTRCGLHKYR